MRREEEVATTIPTIIGALLLLSIGLLRSTWPIYQSSGFDWDSNVIVRVLYQYSLVTTLPLFVASTILNVRATYRFLRRTVAGHSKRYKLPAFQVAFGLAVPVVSLLFDLYFAYRLVRMEPAAVQRENGTDRLEPSTLRGLAARVICLVFSPVVIPILIARYQSILPSAGLAQDRDSGEPRATAVSVRSAKHGRPRTVVDTDEWFAASPVELHYHATDASWVAIVPTGYVDTYRKDALVEFLQRVIAGGYTKLVFSFEQLSTTRPPSVVEAVCLVKDALISLGGGITLVGMTPGQLEMLEVLGLLSNDEVTYGQCTIPVRNAISDGFSWFDRDARRS